MSFVGHREMKETIYIFSNGRLSRKDNTIFFETKQGDKKFIPVEHVKEIFAFGEIDINSKALIFLSQKNIIFHYFNYYNYYSGSFYPREHYNSGFMIIKQVDFYKDNDKRIYLAIQFVLGAAKNCLKILKYYNRRGKDLNKIIDETEEIIKKVSLQKEINSLMAFEGMIKQIYYQAFNVIIENKDFTFHERNKRPPKDYINALISFSNSIIYTQSLSEIYKTHLDPRIAYLHTSNFRRFSLNLDIAEIFKPIIGDRTIFSVINRKIITKKHFDNNLKGVILNEKGCKKFLQHIEERLKETIKHRNLNKKVSYRRLIRMELYKLEKHLMGEKEYKPFVMDW